MAIQDLVDIQDAIGPKRMEIDDEDVESRSVDDLIKAATFDKAQAAAGSPAFGLRFSRMIPPGTVGHATRPGQ